MILKCTVCGGVYNNTTPDYMLSGVKPLDNHGVCLKCDVTSFVGEYILKIGTDDFDLHDVPETPPEPLTARREPDDGSQWIVNRHVDVLVAPLTFQQMSLF